MFKYFLPTIIAVLFVFSADAAVKIKNHTADQYVDGNEMVDDSEGIAILENDIRILDEEIAKCKKQKKGWVAATVVGSVGVVATGTAAVVQGTKIKNKKEEYKAAKDELKTKQQELDKLNNPDEQ